jgi:hypothetical protein
MKRIFMNDDACTPTTWADPIKIDCDWHYQRDQKVLFVFRVERAGRKSHVEILIDLLQLDKDQAERLEDFLERLHAHQTSATERVRTAEWLIDLSLCQQRPEVTKAERDAEVRALLLFKDSQKEEAPEIGQRVLSAKQAIFAVRGQNFINSTGRAAFFEDCQRLPHYQEIYESCLEAWERFDFGFPKVPTASPSEQTLAEVFFLELRYDPNPVMVQARYDSLIQPHLGDQQWLDAIAGTIQKRLKPEESLPGLDFKLLGCWVHYGLWGLPNQDRHVVLAGLEIKTTPEIIRQRRRVLKLRDWSNFKAAYPSSPFEYVMPRLSESGKEMFSLSIRPQYRKWLKKL